MSLIYWAHSDRDGLAPDAPGSKWQLLSEHLRSVAKSARSLAELATPFDGHFHDVAEWCGLLHDYGKYTDCFQERIRGKAIRCPHAIHGAAMGVSHLKALHVALAIAGHHAGIPDRGEFLDRVKNASPEAVGLLVHAGRDLPDIKTLLQGRPPDLEHIGARFDLFTRMAFSCLVDADRLDTSGRPIVQASLDAANRLHMLLRDLDRLPARNAESVVMQARREVLADCLNAAAFPESILSLSVPTGGGKTLSSMAFALKRAQLYPDLYRRIIVVIPYLSIIEQNAEVYSKVFGNDAILEHHSGSFSKLERGDDDHFKVVTEKEDRYQQRGLRPETENWDAPLIVTTSVRFFESLFSNHPSDLRRVHNIARSIVILDEVQVLPRPLLGPLLGMMDELTRDWGCSFVLSTATKPAFEKPVAAAIKDLRWKAGTVREIVQNPAELHRKLRRVTIDWRIQEVVDWPEVAEWLLAEKQALCVVNIKDHAAKLFDLLGPPPPGSTFFHLSTRMCAAHRLDIIAEVRQRLKEKLPCLVVSTQLIEAGVDLDFPIAFRALGPLDSIIQVAGRADREGTLTAALNNPGGRLVVFKPLDHRMPPNEYENATGITETMVKARAIQPDDLEAMGKFFELYYGTADLGAKFVDQRLSAKFATLADEFEMISSRTQDVFAPYGEGKNLIDELFRVGRLTGSLRRRLQRYTVGLQPWEFQAAKKFVLGRVRADEDIWSISDTAYDGKLGLMLSNDSAKLILG